MGFVSLRVTTAKRSEANKIVRGRRGSMARRDD
jgi:hypothetical protein